MSARRPRLPADLALYRAATAALAGLAPAALAMRARAGKEDPARLGERLATAPTPRPAGPLVWLHAASVGESLVALSLADRLRALRPDLAFLFTSGTTTSATLVAARIAAPDLHRFVPVDAPAATRRFVDGWRPDLAIFVEGEIWPNLILATREAGVPLALVNARMTARSARGWSRRMASARLLFDAFEVALPADGATAKALSALRTRAVGPAGNLKLAAPAPAFDEAERTRLMAAIGDRPTWLAASTHAGEEAMAIAAHGALKLAGLDALLVVAPRHPDRAADVELEARKAGIAPIRRSRGDVPEASTEVMIWDTMGELGLAYALAPVALVGGSLVDGVGGHNPVEPARLGSAIVTGPYVHNFADLYADLLAGGAVLLADPSGAALARAVAGLVNDADARTRSVAAAHAVVEAGAAAMDRTSDALLPLLPPPVAAETRP